MSARIPDTGWPARCAAIPVLCLASLSILMAPGCGPKPQQVGGNYPPITAARLTGASYSNRTGLAKPLMDWEFTADEMTLATREDALPSLLVEAILGENKQEGGEAQPWSVKKITAAWSIDGETLTLTNIKYDDQPLEQNCRLRIFNTGVIRIEAAGNQYVFSHH